jgi:two-component system sensor histidine kinase UhpB
LHDGLAGNLISIKALAADTEEDSLPKINDLARLALLDLRLVVESLDSFDGDLAAVLAAFRERILPQYQQTEPQLTWDFSDAPHLEGLTPEINLGIFRILQEALANAFRHGNARHIRVTARSMRGAPDVALILVADDGKPDRTAAPGFGIRNMRRRAASIGAGMRIMFTERGTAVILRIRASGRERNEVAISKNG